MQAIEMEKHRVDLSKRGCVPATNFNARWSCSYGTHGMSAVAHNYYTSKGALIKVYDIYRNGVYETSFDTKKTAMAYMENREKGFEIKMSLDEVRSIYNSGYAGRAKLREMGIGVTLDGKVWDRNGAYIGEV